MQNERQLKSISDDELLRRLMTLLRSSRRVEADLIAHIAEVDERRLYAREAASSMFAYCTEVLHLSEPEAALRIRVARASTRHPMLLAMLRDGRIHLSGIALLAPLLTRRNREAVLKCASYRSKRRIQELVAELEPRPDVPATMRKLPARREKASGPSALPRRPDAVTVAEPEHKIFRDVGTAPAVEQRPDAVAPPARSATVEPLAPTRFRVQFTASAELRDKLERLQALMRSSVPDGDLAAIIDRAVTEKLERLEAKRFAKTKAPRKTLAETDSTPKSRYIPAAVRRTVDERDGGRCTYRDKHGRRCTKRYDLEFHHRAPFGRGGDHSPGTLSLLCKPHNALMAEHDYGKQKMARFRLSASRVSEPVAVYAIGSARRLTAHW